MQVSIKFVGAYAGHTDLADDVTVVVRRLDVQNKEAERGLGGRRDTRLPQGRGLRLRLRAGSSHRKKEALALPFDRRQFPRAPPQATQRGIDKIARLVKGLHPAPVPSDGVIRRKGTAVLSHAARGHRASQLLVQRAFLGIYGGVEGIRTLETVSRLHP